MVMMYTQNTIHYIYSNDIYTEYYILYYYNTITMERYTVQHVTYHLPSLK